MASLEYLSDMEKWHDYQIDSQREISRLLRASCEQQNALKMSVSNSDTDFVAIQILAVDAEHNEVIIDRPESEEQVQRIMQAPTVACETTRRWPCASG
ncbi:MAG: flagellar brake protein [Burkholderiales bacterium]|nr:flagellar brake protein [Burkholderiales bacterium]